MKEARQIAIHNNCTGCGVRSRGFFCDLPLVDLAAFETIKTPKSYAVGARLFSEGQPSAGIFLLCHGRVKLSASSAGGKVLTVGTVGPGDVLGLSSAISGSDHHFTAEALEPSRVSYCCRNEFLRFIETRPSAAMNAARQLSRDHLAIFGQVCSLGLSDTVYDRLARLFLSWCGNGYGYKANGTLRLANSYSHREIAEMVGSSRETVTRALKSFRENGLVSMKGPELVIHDPDRLRALVGARPAMRAENAAL